MCFTAERDFKNQFGLMHFQFFCIFFYFLYILYIDNQHQSTASNDVRETPPPSPTQSQKLNDNNNRKLAIDDDILHEDPNGLINVEYIKLKKILVQPMHDVDLLYEPKTLDSDNIGTGKIQILLFVKTTKKIVPQIFFCMFTND